VTGLEHFRGKKILSENDKWLLARIAPPDLGTFSEPVDHGLNKTCRIGPIMKVFKNR
jgi:hypothetical protein